MSKLSLGCGNWATSLTWEMFSSSKKPLSKAWFKSLYPPSPEKGGGPLLQLLQLEFQSPKDALCQVWLKLAKRFWRRRFQYLWICYYLPLEKQTWVPSPRMRSLNKIGRMVLEKKIFNSGMNYFCYFVVLSS